MNPINAVAYFYAGYGNSEVGMGWAAVYVRISEDRPGLQAGAQRQQEDCLRLAEQLGFTDLLVLVDNDVSAFDGGRRTGHDTLVAQIRGGVSRIVLWHVGRLYRRPRDFEGLLELVE